MNDDDDNQLERAVKSRQDPIDRLTHLHDSILHHILSFLDTKESVRTSVLSRPWRHAWKYVPVLNFRHSFRPESLIGYGDPEFERYVDKVLSLRYPLLRKISYENPFKEVHDDSLLVRVLDYAISNGIEHLSLCSGRGFGSRFPVFFDSVFDWNLETLELESLVIDSRFQSFGFQRLITLELTSCLFSFGDDEELLDPFLGCSYLENLVLKDCTPFLSYSHPLKTKILRISGLQLRNLRLENTTGYKLEIFAPYLVSFTILNCEEALKFETELPSLEHVHIQLTPLYFCVEHEITKDHWVFMFRCFRNVKSLTLSSRIIKALWKISDFLERQQSPFVRLEKLNLMWPYSNDIPNQVMNYFLKRCSSSNPRINILQESCR
ncbi:Putative F-box/LRR-repeat protein At5g02930 [Linum perenne]